MEVLHLIGMPYISHMHLHIQICTRSLMWIVYTVL